MNKMNKEKTSGGDPCLWLCFPCLFTMTVCETMCRACCITICCIKPYSVDTIDKNDFDN